MDHCDTRNKVKVCPRNLSASTEQMALIHNKHIRFYLVANFLDRIKIISLLSVQMGLCTTNRKFLRSSRNPFPLEIINSKWWKCWGQGQSVVFFDDDQSDILIWYANNLTYGCTFWQNLHWLHSSPFRHCDAVLKIDVSICLTKSLHVCTSCIF